MVWSLSYKAERQANDRVSFRHSLNYPGTIGIAQQSGVREDWPVREGPPCWNKLQNNAMKKDTRLNEGLSRTPLSSQRILAMLVERG